jgi:site-specific recombinase XerD
MIEETSTPKISETIAAATDALVQSKYRPESLRKFKAVWNKLIQYAQTKEVQIYSVELSQNFLRDTYHLEAGTKLTPKDHSKARAIQILTNVYLNQTINLWRKYKEFHLPDSFKAEIEGFLQEEMGRFISPSHRARILYTLCNFIDYLSQQGIPQLSTVSPQDIHRYLQTLTDYCQRTIKSNFQILRWFFTYLYTSGFSHQNLSLSIPSIRMGATGATLPSVYTEDEILRLLKAVDRANPIGKRDYAILLMATKLGLRRSDLQNLKLENLKWETNRIELVQEKTGQVLNLPILEEIGVALIDYLKNGRPKVLSEYVFLKHVPAYEELSPTALTNIATKYFRQASITLPKGKKHGLHALRHSLASHLLENQTPIVVIAEILGHLNSHSTGIYLKIDLDQLRTCALEVPHAAD